MTKAAPGGDAARPADGLRLERREDVLWITLDRPEKRNALSRPLLAALEREALARHADPDLRLVIVTGAGDRSFAAGGDLGDLASVRDLPAATTMARDARRALDALRDWPVPVVAALNGDALGGGAELAAACDFRIAVAQARIGFIQGRLAITTAWGGGDDLMRLVGPHVALRLLCRQEVLAPAEALSVGLYDAIAADQEPLAEAVARFCAPMLTLPPQVLRAFKRLSAAGRAGTPRAGLAELETALFAETWVHPDHWSAVDALFAGRRAG